MRVDVVRRVRFAAAVLIYVFVVGLFATAGPVRGAVTSVSIHMVGEAPLSAPDGTPVLVAGIWHEVSVDLSAPVGSVAINATFPGAAPDGMRTTYRWTWDSSGTWLDPLYDTFIRPDLSRSDGARLTFVVGVDAQATAGRWQFAVFEGSQPVTTLDVSVEAPFLSYAFSAADFDFHVEPFTSGVRSSRPSGEYIRVANQGNVPLRLAVAFDLLQDELSVENPSDVAHVYSEALYYIQVAASARPPSVIEVQGTSRVEPLHLVPSSGSATINPAVEGTFSLRLRVGRSGYGVQVVGNVAFQTLETVRVDYGAIATWQVYFTGAQSVSLSIAVSNARLAGVFSGGQPLSLPATLAVSPDSEYPVTVQVEATQPGTASVTFTIHLLVTGDTRSFITSVLVAGGPGPSDPTASYLWILGSIAAASVFGLVGVSQWRHRREGPANPIRGATTNGGKRKLGYNARRRIRNERRRNVSNGRRAKARGTWSRGTRPSRLR